MQGKTLNLNATDYTYELSVNNYIWEKAVPLYLNHYTQTSKTEISVSYTIVNVTPKDGQGRYGSSRRNSDVKVLGR